MSSICRDLLVLVSFHVVQSEDRARAWWQRGDRRVEIHSLGVHLAPSQRSDLVVRLLVREPRTSPPFRPLRFQHDVHGELVQPRRERRIAAELRQPVPRSHECVLRELFRASTIATHADADREHTVEIRTVQPLERTPVAAGCQPHVVGIAPGAVIL